MQTHLVKMDGYYPIYPNISNLYKISNLAPNTKYNISFNDLLTIFLTNQNGELYFNNKKEPLPMQCLYETDTRLSKLDHGKDSRNPDPPGDPIAYYYVDSYDCNKSRSMFLNLGGKEEVEFIISGGAIGRSTNIEYYNQNIFSGVGIL
jgi:hypothetical protein